MSDQKIRPEKVTKPIQLLAAWLVGLLAVDTAFLIAASQLPQGGFQSIALTIAAILNVPGFLWALFLLQTKFRPELQEDIYYSTYINRKTNEQVSITRDEQLFSGLHGKLERMEVILNSVVRDRPDLGRDQDLGMLSISVNKFLPDKHELEVQLPRLGVPEFGWFGGFEPPEHRVVAITDALTAARRQAVLKLAHQLGFKHYSDFDSTIDEISEDVLLGAYGDKGIPITEADIGL